MPSWARRSERIMSVVERIMVSTGMAKPMFWRAANGHVHADHFAVDVDEWAARVARIDRSVRSGSTPGRTSFR